MGAFFLYHQNSGVNEMAIRSLYSSKGFKNPLMTSLGEYNLIHFRKQCIGIENHLKIGENHIYVTGSILYKGSGFKEGIELLLKDFVAGNVCLNEIYGIYSIIFFNERSKELTLSFDPAFLKNIYFDPLKKVITSDFLALTEAFPKTYSLNRLAFIESLVTGCLISPDTYANEIQKLDKINVGTLPFTFSGLKISVFYPQEIYKDFGNPEEAVCDCDERLSKYFRALKKLSGEFGVHLGLTGGFDSRMLLMYSRKNLESIVTNSFWRENSDDFLIAKELAKTVNLDFNSFEGNSFRKPDTEILLRNSYYFFDGQIRSQNKWEEEFSLPEYIIILSSDHLIGLHGCGGEQYRNGDKLMRKIPLRTYILYDWIFKQCPKVIKDKKLLDEVFLTIKRKIIRLVQVGDNKIGLSELKRIQNEVWNSANRTTRLNALNQLMFYFAPFTEYSVSHSAYSYVPYLGNSYSFQKKLMVNIDKELSRIKTNHGFRISDNESVKYRIAPYLLNLIPRSFVNKIFFMVKHLKSDSFKEDEFKKYADPVFLKMIDGIDLNELGANSNLGWGLNSMNYLITKINLK